MTFATFLVPVGRPLRPVHRGYGAVASRRLWTVSGFSRRRSASSQVIGRAVAVGTSLARRRLVASACGRAVLRGARWLVAQDDHAGVERRGVREFERLADGVIEEPLAFPDHDRIDPDPDVVDEVMVKQRVYEPPAAVDEQVASGPLLEAAHLLDDVAVEDGGVPLRLFEGLRDHELREAVHPVGETVIS